MDKIKENLLNYLPPEAKIPVVIDPLYVLKGAARAAQEFYRPPGWSPEIEPINVFQVYEGRIYEHSEGKLLLENLKDLALALHNIGNKTRDSTNTFKEILQYDPIDHLVTQ